MICVIKMKHIPFTAEGDQKNIKSKNLGLSKDIILLIIPKKQLECCGEIYTDNQGIIKQSHISDLIRLSIHNFDHTVPVGYDDFIEIIKNANAPTH